MSGFVIFSSFPNTVLMIDNNLGLLSLNISDISRGSSADSFLLDSGTKTLKLLKELDRELSLTYDLVVFVRFIKSFEDV